MSIRTRSSSLTKQRSISNPDDDHSLESANLLPPPSPPPSLPRRVLSQTLTTTANLANLLPTGTVLAFQFLIPIFTKNGRCDAATGPLTLLLLCLLSLSCFLASFTDSFQSPDGQVFYGFVTPKGLWLFDYPAEKVPDLSRYRLRLIDGVHAVLSVFVFVGLALRDKNVIGCFYPKPSHEIQEVLDIVPIGIGVICSLLFVAFPTRRHGIGYPVTPSK